MHKGTGAWEQTVDHLVAVLDELDPYGLSPGGPDGSPPDEYALEAVPIARHLIAHGTIGVDDVDAILMHWFGEPLSGVIGSGAMSRAVAELGVPSRATPGRP